MCGTCLTVKNKQPISHNLKLICVISMQEAMTCEGILDICKAAGKDRKLQARRVSEAWLKAYLDAAEQAAVAKLSVFAGSFSVEGAAALLAGAGALHQSWVNLDR